MSNDEGEMVGFAEKKKPISGGLSKNASKKTRFRKKAELGRHKGRSDRRRKVEEKKIREFSWASVIKKN